VNALFALHQALAMLREEGLEASFARHNDRHHDLVAALSAIGLAFPIDAAIRLPQLNLVSIPSGVADAATRKALLDNFGLEIGAGLGPLAGKVWRIGVMGQSATRRHVALCAGALKSVLNAPESKSPPG
jgi:alanine-glyoxylate transaminase/serine-glyoxylate transaminase/serine-pyruvate transaminase